MKTRLPKCHYLWVGPPPAKRTNDRVILDHDTGDVFAMANCLENPINFWCLEEFVDYYQDKFQNKPITVRSINNYLNVKSSVSDKFVNESAKEVMHIIHEYFKPERSKNIDYISAKDIFSLFLLANSGGYTMDTNIGPLSESRFSMPAFYTFQVPYVTDWKVYECWMMYAPKYNLNAKKILKYYLRHWPQTQKYFLDEGYSKPYHKELATIMINGLMKYASRERPWLGSLVVNTVDTVTLPQMRVRKIYGGTHKHTDMFKQIIKLHLEMDNVRYFTNKRILPHEQVVAIKSGLRLGAFACVTYLMKQAIVEETDFIIEVLKKLLENSENLKELLAEKPLPQKDVIALMNFAIYLNNDSAKQIFADKLISQKDQPLLLRKKSMNRHGFFAKPQMKTERPKTRVRNLQLNSNP